MKKHPPHFTSAMFRRGHLFLLLAAFGVSFLTAWRLGLFDSTKRPALPTLENLKVLQNVNKVLNSIPVLQKPNESVQLVGTKPVTAKPIETKPVVVAATEPKPPPAKPLPVLTSEPQDNFYGKGCKVNRYRGRLQQVLAEWQKIVVRRNIDEYFICFGSFLGSKRNGDIVPYDSDMDVCMFRHEYHKLYPEESKRPVNLNDGKIHMLLQRHSPHPKANTPRKDCRGKIVRSVTDNCAILDPHGRLYLGALIYLDIFMIEDHGSELWDEYRDRIHPRDAILPTKPCKYLGIDTQCPNNDDKYLNVYYGKDYMKPHHVCRGGRWVQNVVGARRPFV